MCTIDHWLLFFSLEKKKTFFSIIWFSFKEMNIWNKEKESERAKKKKKKTRSPQQMFEHNNRCETMNDILSLPEINWPRGMLYMLTSNRSRPKHSSNTIKVIWKKKEKAYQTWTSITIIRNKMNVACQKLVTYIS